MNDNSRWEMIWAFIFSIITVWWGYWALFIYYIYKKEYAKLGVLSFMLGLAIISFIIFIILTD